MERRRANVIVVDMKEIVTTIDEMTLIVVFEHAILKIEHEDE